MYEKKPTENIKTKILIAFFIIFMWLPFPFMFDQYFATMYILIFDNLAGLFGLIDLNLMTNSAPTTQNLFATVEVKDKILQFDILFIYLFIYSS